MTDPTINSPTAQSGAYRIRRFNLSQLMKVTAVLYALFGLVAIPFVFIGLMFAGDRGMIVGLITAILLPVLYAVIGAIASLIGGAIYNFVARLTGGIEWEIEKMP